MIARASKKVIIFDPLFEHSMLGVVVNKPEDIGQQERVVFQPISNTVEVFEEFCKYIWQNRENILVIFDEVDEHADLYNLPVYFGRLVRLGRHKGIGVVGITRRIANVNKTLPALSHHIISFRQTLPNDVGYLADFIGWKNASKLRDLPDYYYLHFDWKTAEIGKTRPDRQQPVQEMQKNKEKTGKETEGKSQSVNDTTEQLQKESLPEEKEKVSKSFF